MQRKLALPFLALLLFAAGCDAAADEPPTPTATQPPTAAPSATPTFVPTPTVTPIPVDRTTLEILQSVDVPAADAVELARRLGGVTQDIPEALPPPAVPLEVGARQRFWVSNQDDESFQIDATLQFITEHAYIWIDDTKSFDPAEVERLANVFENRIYPTNRAFFGSEWTPGIDGDEHIYILYARRLGLNIGGYFSSADSEHPLVHPFSNAHEMFVLNADNLSLADEFTYGVLAHEFQHMIHWNVDRNEALWMNEGFSEVAVRLNRYEVGGTDQIYAQDPDIQLNDWPNGGETLPYYGASFLYLQYFLDRFGDEVTQAVVQHPLNGLESIDQVLADFAIEDPLTGMPIRADDVAIDWAIANFVNDDSVGDGRYDYANYISAPRTRQTEVLRDCDEGPYEFDVRQYGVDYLRILCPGTRILRFEGAVETQLLPAGAQSGSFAFWSNKGDDSDMTLTRAFDFSGVTGPLTLRYSTWYDIERDWDYVYLLASIDGGETWRQLETPSCTDRNPHGNNYGCGITGTTRGGEWIEESVDLAEFAGRQILLRFEYVTDAGVNGEGMLLDDISVPEIGYSTDFEDDDGGWQAEGFVRVNNVLPQTFRLALLRQVGDGISVEILPVGINNRAEASLEIPEDEGSVVLVVMGTTRFTRQPATYRLDFGP